MKTKEGGVMDIKEEILAQMDSALRPEFDKAIDNTIEGAFKEDVKTLGFMVANSIKCQWEVMKPYLFYAYCLGVKAQEAKAQAVPDTYTPIVLALEDVQSKIAKASFLTMDAENESEVYAVDTNEISAYIDELIEAQEPTDE